MKFGELLKRRRWTIIGISAVALIAISRVGAAKAPTQVEVVEAKVAPAKVVLSASGRVEAISEAKVASSLSALRVTRVNFDEGQTVEQGDVLIELDQSDLNAQIAEAEASHEVALRTLAKANESLEGAKRSYEISQEQLNDATDLVSARDTAQTNVSTAKQRLSQAKSRLSKAQEGGRKEEARRYELALANAKLKLEQAGRTLERNRQLLKENVISKSEFEDSEVNYRTLESDFASAKEQLKLTQNSRQQDVEEASASVREAQETLTGAERTLATSERNLRERLTLRSQTTSSQNEVANAKRQIDVSEGELEKAEANIRRLRDQLSKTKILAPISGVVAEVSIKVGEVAQPAAQLLRVTSTRNFRVVVDIDEKQVNRLEIGQRAIVSPEAFPSLQIPASIDQIKRSANSAKGTIAVRLKLSKGDPRLRADLTTDVNIEVEDLQSAVVVPEGSVFQVGEKNFALKIINGTAEQVEVVSGSNSSAGLIILKGLTAGDAILRDPRLVKPGQSVVRARQVPK